MSQLAPMLAALPNDLAGFERLCAAVTAWEPLLASAAHHGVEGLLEYYLLRLPQLPAGLDAAHLERQLALRRLRQLRLNQPLGEALDCLDRAGIRTVVLKGPLLAERLYPAAGLRSSSDLDLMVAEADLDGATAALEGLGYEAETGLLARYYRENHHHIHLHREWTPPVELHFRATTGFGTIVPAEDLLARALPYRTASGSPAWVLAPEDEVLYLAVHAARHLLSAFVWLYDLKLILERHPDLDWPVLAARARALRVTQAVALALETARLRLDVPLPEDSRLAPWRGLRAQLARMLLSSGSQRAGLRSKAFRILLCDRPAASAWSFRHRVWRGVRRRAQRYLPWAIPAAWSR